jgi:hypothetical protein
MIWNRSVSTNATSKQEKTNSRYCANNGHDNAGDGGDDGVDTPTNGRNDRTLKITVSQGHDEKGRGVVSP